MKIVVEGPDGSGKSTLVRYLGDSLGLAVVPGEGPPKSPQEINDRVDRYSRLDNVIFDRHPCVSNPIYDTFRNVSPMITAARMQRFKAEDVLFIYCRGNGLDDHQVMPHDTPEHLDMISQHASDIEALYDIWGMRNAHLLYRKGETSMSLMATMMSSHLDYSRGHLWNPLADVAEFHAKFGLYYEGKPRALPGELFEFRNKFLREERKEWHDNGFDLLQLMQSEVDPAEYAFKLEQQLDALIDLQYVLLGTAQLQGFMPVFREAWRRVHAANMKKVRAVRAEDSKRGSTFDVIKPAGWTPPSHIDLVEVHDIA